MTALLSARALSLSFAGVRALDAVDLNIDAGELVGIIGPNGSGKSTLFNVLSGIYRLDHGTVSFRDERIDRLNAERVSRRGLARTFQNKRLFGSLSVHENVRVPAMSRAQGSVLGDVFGLSGSRLASEQAADLVARCLQVTGLAGSGHILAGDLAYGAQNRLEIARALALEPQLLLLDEPAAGLNPAERTDLAELVRKVHAQGVTIALVEHDVRMVASLCDRTIVFDHGEKIADGATTEVVNDARVQAAYFGTAGTTENSHAV